MAYYFRKRTLIYDIPHDIRKIIVLKQPDLSVLIRAQDLLYTASLGHWAAMLKYRFYQCYVFLNRTDCSCIIVRAKWIILIMLAIFRSRATLMPLSCIPLQGSPDDTSPVQSLAMLSRSTRALFIYALLTRLCRCMNLISGCTRNFYSQSHHQLWLLEHTPDGHEDSQNMLRNIVFMDKYQAY